METAKKGRVLRLILGMLVLFFAGIIYAWSILKAPLAAEFGWTQKQLAFNFTLTLCFFCIGGTLSGLLARKTSALVRMLAAGVLTGAGFIIASLIDGGSPAPLYIAYGVMCGLGIGIVYNTVISATASWFPDKKGLCSGCLMMAFGLSTLALGALVGALIDTAAGWRGAYRLLGCVIGGVILLAGFFVKSAPAAAKKEGQNDVSNDLTPAQMLARPSFWLLFVFFILLSAVGSTAISFAKDFALSLSVSDAAAVAIVGALSICNGLGRLCSGAVFDWLGLRKAQFVTSAVALAAPLAAIAAIVFSSPALGIIGLCLCGFSYGFSPTMSAAFSGAFYGQKHFPVNFSLLNLVLIPSSFASTAAGAMVTTSGGYLSAFIMLACFSAVGAAVNLMIKKP